MVGGVLGTTRKPRDPAIQLVGEKRDLLRPEIGRAEVVRPPDAELESVRMFGDFQPSVTAHVDGYHDATPI